MEAARRYILSDHPAIIVVGDAAKLKKALESLGPVIVSNGKGKTDR
jgi:hypothetical protein